MDEEGKSQARISPHGGLRPLLSPQLSERLLFGVCNFSVSLPLTISFDSSHWAGNHVLKSKPEKTAPLA